MIDEVNKITEFNDNELKAISMIQNDEFLANLLVFYIDNKKHIKRKYSGEIISVFDKIGNALSDSPSYSANGESLQKRGLF